MAASMRIFVITKMKESRSWTVVLWGMKHGFASSPQNQKETPGLGNILIHALQKIKM
jgi:hypothetical protein